MKYVLTAILISFSLYSYGQFSWGVKAGLNINDIAVEGLPKGIEDKSSTSIGFHFGTYGEINISEKFSFIPELQL
ncbi:MAG TPA: outer membrane beta-barrel protein [Ohtaekwangia sp.]|nr:outer membrane beta-barrel protein [Ohtaekwangia sp.]